MASQQELSFAIRAVNEASAALKSIQGDVDKLGQAADQAEGKGSKFGSALGGIGTVAGGIVAAGAISKIGGYLTDAVQGAIEDEAATKRLEQALRNAGGAYDENLAKVNAAIDAGQQKAFTDDQVRDSFQSLLAATGDVNEALSRQQVAMDLSRGAGISLEQASRMVGKVNDENVEAFKRLGITIGEGATEAEALAAVQAKFAGQSDAYAKSTAGQFEQAKIRMGEVQEQIGAQLLPVVTKLGLIFLNDVVPAIEKFVNVAGPKVSEFAADVKSYWESDIRPALDSLKQAWEKLSPVIIPILETIGNHIKNVATILGDVVSLILALISGDWSRAWDIAKQLVADFVKLVTDDINGIVDIIQGALPLIVEAAKAIGTGIFNAIWEGLGDLWQLGADAIEWILRGLKDNAGKIASWAKETLDPRKWDIPGLSPFLPAYEHAGQLAGANLVRGMVAAVAADGSQVRLAASEVARDVFTSFSGGDLYANVPAYVKKLSPAAGGDKTAAGKSSDYVIQYEGGGQYGYLRTNGRTVGDAGPNGTVWDGNQYVMPWEVGNFGPGARPVYQQITVQGSIWSRDELMYELNRAAAGAH